MLESLTFKDQIEEAGLVKRLRRFRPREGAGSLPCVSCKGWTEVEKEGAGEQENIFIIKKVKNEKTLCSSIPGRSTI